LAGLILAFIPPDGFTAFPPAVYPWVVGAVIVVLGAPALVFYGAKRPEWDRRSDAEKSKHGTHEEDEALASE
jgi:glutamate:GABA antiporter